MKRLFCIALIAALGIPSLAAQSAPGTAVFAPFVSRLEGEIKNNFVRLSWLDSPDVKGPVYIFRSTLPFDGLNLPPLSASREIPYGTQSFVDEIETGVTLYYFAAASDETGRRYDIPIHFGNTLEIKSGSDGPAALPAPAEAASSASLAAGISNLEAVSRGDKVIVSFRGSAESVTLYRSVRPIGQTADLLGAVIVQTRINSPYTDTPVPGIPYYYAAVPGEDLVRGTIEIIPGRNATTAPAAAYAGQGAAPGGDIRAMPLPEISVEAAIPGTPSAAGVSSPAELSPRADGALSDIPARPRKEPVLKKPRVFARDFESYPAGGEENALSSIVKGSFASKNWEKAREELVRFLSLPRSAETAARARFYLGQCRYFLRQPREGLFEFLAIQERYPAESAEWIQASLAMMKE